MTIISHLPIPFNPSLSGVLRKDNGNEGVADACTGWIDLVFKPIAMYDANKPLLTRP